MDTGHGRGVSVELWVGVKLPDLRGVGRWERQLMGEEGGACMGEHGGGRACVCACVGRRCKIHLNICALKGVGITGGTLMHMSVARAWVGK